MDASTTAGFVALALCIPVITFVVLPQVSAMRNLVQRLTGKGKDRPPKLPPGRSPYHLP